MTKEEQAKTYEEYSDKIFHYVLLKVSNRTVAEDLTSQVFLKFVEKADTYDEDKASVGTWIYSIARNTVIDYYRTNKIHSELDEDIEEESSVEDVLIEKEDLENLADAMMQLDERERNLIVFHYYDDMKIKDIAQKMKISYSMAKIVHKKALDKLEKLL